MAFARERERAFHRFVQPRPAVTVLPRRRWLTQVPDVTDDSCTWYTDGSVVHMGWEHYTVAACAIVVVSPDGALVGVAEVLLCC